MDETASGPGPGGPPAAAPATGRAEGPADAPHRPRGPEHALLINRRLDLFTALGLLVATVAVFALYRFPGTRDDIQRLDDHFLQWLIRVRRPALTSVAKVLNVVGGVWVTLPIRLGVSGFLAFRRRWWHFTAFVLAMVLSEVSISILKVEFDRPRPPGGLVTTSGASFPSGHAIATASTAVAVGIALFPPGLLHRWVWGAVAVILSFVMGCSRAYLGAHWLSDVVAGILLGASIALLTALIVESVRRGGGGPRPGSVLAEARVATGPGP